MTTTINEKDYEFVLNAKACVELEKKLGTNPVNTLVRFAEKNEVPSFVTLFQIIQASLPKTIKAEDVYDDLLAEGKGFSDLMDLVVEIFKDAGLIPDEAEVDEEKN